LLQYSLLSGQDSQARQACNCKVIRFKSVRWHDDWSSEHSPVGWSAIL